MSKTIDVKGGPNPEKAVPKEPAKELAGFERDVLVRLGAAVLDVWDRLSRERQQKLFSVAIADPGVLDVEGLRRRLAVILHAHHERTGRSNRSVRDGHPPAGPHARPELTNFDATPGSGLMAPRRGRDREVDPGAG